MLDPRSLAGLTLCSLALAACGGEVQRPPDVVLVVVDTLRADRLGTYGCSLETAPFVDRLAREGVVFENAWSPSSWTLPAAVSVITSVHPFQHGVTDYDGLELGPGEEPVPVNCIPAEVETLAETLQRAGYRTFGVVSNVLVGPEVGFDRGFERFVRLEDEDADAVNAQVRTWREELRGDRPTFLYVHYIDPHDPFHARQPWFDQALEAEARSWPDPAAVPDGGLFGLGWLARRLEPRPEWMGERRVSELTPDERQRLVRWMRAAYDSEIRFVDDRIRALYEELGLDDAIVVFLADHGEEFYEHGDLTHGQNLHAETVRVPLLVRLPGGVRGGERVATDVTTLDVLPTLRGLLGLSPSAQDAGRDLLGAPVPRPILAHLEGRATERRFAGEQRSLLLGDHRLIRMPDGTTRLYDVRQDPGETRDLTSERPERALELTEALERTVSALTPYPATRRLPGAASEAMLEHLSGTGYAGGDGDEDD